MPMASVATLVTRATPFSASSCWRGTNSMTSTPASGRKIPTLSIQLLAVRFIPLLHGDDEDEGADGGRSEQDRSVLLDLARLHRAQGLAAALGGGTAADHGGVEDLLVEVVGDGAGPARAAADAVHDGIQDPLVEPVRQLGDRALDAGHHDVLVKGVEVVLVPEEGVPGGGGLVARRQPSEHGPLVDSHAGEVRHDGTEHREAD